MRTTKSMHPLLMGGGTEEEYRKNPNREGREGEGRGGEGRARTLID